MHKGYSIMEQATWTEDKLMLKRNGKTQEESGIISSEKGRNTSRQNSRAQVARVVIGILSHSNYTCLRDTQRALFVKAAKAYSHLDINVFFLLDQPNPELHKEQRLHNDMVYLHTTEHDWNVNFAKKLYNWYKFAVAHFPDAMLIGRMDDDVFVCTPQIFDLGGGGGGGLTRVVILVRTCRPIL